MEAFLAGAATAAIAEGVKFLYQQAGEILTAWRRRRRDASAPPPQVLPAPEGVTVGSADPLPDAPSSEAVDILQELKDRVEPIKDGTIAAEDSEARKTLAELRMLLESVLRTPITLAGEPPRRPHIADVEVVVQDIAGRVTGVVARGDRDVERVKVTGGRVEKGAVVTGVTDQPREEEAEGREGE